MQQYDTMHGIARTSVYYIVPCMEMLLHMFLGKIVQQDNAPAHKLAETSTWFLVNDVEVFENWPQIRQISMLTKTCVVF